MPIAKLTKRRKKTCINKIRDEKREYYNTYQYTHANWKMKKK
jgi:hypothetical protein